MIQPVANYPNPTPHLQQFLDLLDRTAEAQGRNVPPIVDLEKLRHLPPDTFGRNWADFLDKHNLKPFTTGSRLF
jgi:ubiquinone biosynthesis protein Coq4